MKKIVIAVGMTMSLVACGGGVPQASGPEQRATPSASTETMSLSFLLVPHGSRTATSSAAFAALRSAMVSAGYKIVDHAHVPHDVELGVRVSSEEQRPLFVVVVNGKRDLDERVHLTAAVTMNGQVIDEVSADFVTTNSHVAPDKVLAAVRAIGASQRIAQRGSEIRSRSEEDARRTQRVAEESDWTRARVTGCRQPSSLGGCDAVRTHLAKHPDGAHADEAQAALKASEPLMEKLQKDENTWKTAGSTSCRQDRTHEACTGVEIYVAKFPAGVHLDEAQASLRGLE